MRFVQKWSYSCANHFASVMNENHQRRAIYYYGFYIVIGAVVKGILLILAASLFGVLLPTLLIMFIFGSLRMFAGGYHMDTFNKCMYVSMASYIAAALVAQHTYAYWSGTGLRMLIALTLVSGLYVLLRYAPKDTPNKPVTDPKQRRKLRILSVAYLCLWITITTVLTAFSLNLYVLSLCFGILLELHSITPAGHRFFDRISAAFDTGKTKYRQHRQA